MFPSDIATHIGGFLNRKDGSNLAGANKKSHNTAKEFESEEKIKPTTSGRKKK